MTNIYAYLCGKWVNLSAANATVDNEKPLIPCRVAGILLCLWG